MEEIQTTTKINRQHKAFLKTKGKGLCTERPVWFPQCCNKKM